MEQAQTPTGERRWWIDIADGTRRLTWTRTAAQAKAKCEAKGLSVVRVRPAGNPLEDR